MDKKDAIVITPEMMDDLLTLTNELVSHVAGVGKKHTLQVVVAVAPLVAAMNIIERSRNSCTCAECTDTITALAEELERRWRAVMGKPAPLVGGVH